MKVGFVPNQSDQSILKFNFHKTPSTLEGVLVYRFDIILIFASMEQSQYLRHSRPRSGTFNLLLIYVGS